LRHSLTVNNIVSACSIVTDKTECVPIRVQTIAI